MSLAVVECAAFVFVWIDVKIGIADFANDTWRRWNVPPAA